MVGLDTVYGAVASNGRPERLWFAQVLGNMCSEVEVGSREELRATLCKVVLQDVFFEIHLIPIWEDIILLREVEESIPVIQEESRCISAHKVY